MERKPLNSMFAGDGGRYVVLGSDGVMYGPFYNQVVAMYWREDAEVGGRIYEIQHPWDAPRKA
jgi:hypothetical protein